MRVENGSTLDNKHHSLVLLDSPYAYMSDDSPPSPSLTSIKRFLNDTVVDDFSASSQAGESDRDILEEVRRKRLARQDRFSQLSQQDSIRDNTISTFELGSTGIGNDVFSEPYIPLTRSEDPTSLHLPFGRAPHLTRTSPTASAVSSPGGRIRSVNVPLSPTSPLSPDLESAPPSPTPTKTGGMVIQEIPPFRPKPQPSPVSSGPPSPRMGKPLASSGGKPKIRMSPNLMRNLSLKRNQTVTSNASSEDTTGVASSTVGTSTTATATGTPQEAPQPFESDTYSIPSEPVWSKTSVPTIVSTDVNKPVPPLPNELDGEAGSSETSTFSFKQSSPPVTLQSAFTNSKDLDDFRSVEQYLDQMSSSSSTTSTEPKVPKDPLRHSEVSSPPLEDKRILTGVGRNGEPYEVVRHALSPVSERSEVSSIDTFRSRVSVSRDLNNRSISDVSSPRHKFFPLTSDSNIAARGIIPVVQRRKEVFEHPRSSSLDDLSSKSDEPIGMSGSKSASELIRLFEGTDEGRGSPRKWGHTRGHSEMLPPLQSEEGSSLSKNTRINLRPTRLMEEHSQRPFSVQSFDSMKSAESGLYDTTHTGAVSVLITDTQDPQAPYWRQAQADLHHGFLRLSFHDSSDRVELSLYDLIDVESIRARKTPENEYDMDELATANRKSSVSLHVFQLRWKNGRRERFATEKAQQRSEWVTKIWNMLRFSPDNNASIRSFPIDEETPKKATSNSLPPISLYRDGSQAPLNYASINDTRTISRLSSSPYQHGAHSRLFSNAGFSSPQPSVSPTEEFQRHKLTKLEDEYKSALGSVVGRGDQIPSSQPMDLWAISDSQRKELQYKGISDSPGGATIPSAHGTPYIDHYRGNTASSLPQSPLAHQSISVPNSPDEWKTASDILGPTNPSGPGSKLRRYILHDPGQPKVRPPSSVINSERSFQSGNLSPEFSPRKKGRGAWSDIERKSTKSDVLMGGQVPTRAVARDLQRLLRAMERQDSVTISRSNRLGDHLNDIQGQLVSIAKRLKGHHEGEAGDDPNIADKIDYMLTLCNILLESQHKVSFAVDRTFRDRQASSSDTPSIIEQNTVITDAPVNDPASSTAPSPITPGPSSPMPPPAVPHSDPTVYNSMALDRIEGILHTIVSRINEPITSTQLEPIATSLLETRTLSDNASLLTCDVDFDEDVMKWKRTKGVEIAVLPSQAPPSPPQTIVGLPQSPPSMVPRSLQSDTAAQKMQEERARAQRRLEGQISPQSRSLDYQPFDQRQHDVSPQSTSHRLHQHVPLDGTPGLSVMNHQNLPSRWSEDTADVQLPISRRSSPGDLIQRATNASRERIDGDRTTIDQQDARPPLSTLPALPAAGERNIGIVDRQDPPRSLNKTPTPTLTQESLLEAYKAGAAQHSGILEEIQTALKAHGAAADRSASYQKELSVYIGQMHDILASNMKDRSEEFSGLTAAIKNLQQEFQQVKTVFNTASSPAIIPTVDIQPTSTDPGPDALDSATIPTSSPPPGSGLANGRLTGPRAPKLKTGPPMVFGARVWGGPTPRSDQSDRWGRKTTLKPGSIMGDDVSVYEDASDGTESTVDGMMLESLHQILQEIKDSKDREAAKTIQKEARRREKESQSAELSVLEAKRKEIEELSRRQQEQVDKEHSASLDLLIQQLREQTEAYAEVARSIAEQAELASQSSQQNSQTPSFNPDELLDQLKSGMEGNVTELMSGELKKMLDEINALNEQKRQLQADISSFLEFQARHNIPRHNANPSAPGRPASRMSARPPPSEVGRRPPPRGPPPSQMGGPRGPRPPLGR